jgi:hypothetical protein
MSDACYRNLDRMSPLAPAEDECVHCGERVRLTYRAGSLQEVDEYGRVCCEACYDQALAERGE